MRGEIGMKVVICIPAYNEEKTIASVIREISRDIAEEVEIVVIDDGSTDSTFSEAKKAGADVVVRFKKNRGLGSAFKAGIEKAIDLDADVLVTIDADGQYDPKEIPKLVKPVIDGNADIVLGSRFAGRIEEMPFQKRIGNLIATRVTSFLAGISISDAQTGFRAFSGEAMLQLNMFADYTYVQETIIQAANKRLLIAEVPCTFRKRRGGDSRLIASTFSYAKNAVAIVLKTYLRYKPLKTFLYIGGFILLAGIVTGLRVLIHYMQTGLVTPYYPTTILTAILFIIGFQVIVLGLLADLIDGNRRIEEEILYRLKKR